MEKKELERLVEKYQAKADAAEQAYQETGMTRYYSTYWRNQDMADALRIALSAKEDNDALWEMRLMLSRFASQGAMASDPTRFEAERVDLAMTLAKEIAEYGRRNGLIGG